MTYEEQYKCELCKLVNFLVEMDQEMSTAGYRHIANVQERCNALYAATLTGAGISVNLDPQEIWGEVCWCLASYQEQRGHRPGISATEAARRSRINRGLELEKLNA